MKESLKSSTKGRVAVGLVGLLYLAIIITSRHPLAALLFAAVAFSSSAIAAFDSTHTNLRRYRTGISYGPVGLFLVCALFWPFPVIWYFIVRVRIMRGAMPLRGDAGRPSQTT
jgi:hypothetical protein